MNIYINKPFKYIFFKRIFDLLFSFLLIIGIIPLIFLLIIVITIDLKESPFFLQERPGYKIRTFYIIKFKTMKSIDKNIHISDNQRTTRITRLIRSLRLDELPQLLNIFKGEMSFVGPRPLLIDYLDKYKSSYFKRHNVLPGVTGLAQINGSGMLAFDKRMELDIKYVNNQNFIFDFYILTMTIFYVINNLFSDEDHDKLPKFPIN